MINTRQEMINAFNTMIASTSFNYDGRLYNSIDACYRDRVIGRRLIDPSTLPLQLKYNIQVYGFVSSFSEFGCTIYERGDLTPDQFYMLICANLFVEYYKQISMLVTDTIKYIQYKYLYDSCIDLTQRIELNKTVANLVKYDDVCNSTIHADAVCVNINDSCVKFPTVDLSNIREIHMTDHTLNILYNRNLSTLDTVSNKTVIRVHKNGSSLNDLCFNRLESKGKILLVTDEPLVYNREVIISYGSISYDAGKDNIDWDNVLIVGMQ